MYVSLRYLSALFMYALWKRSVASGQLDFWVVLYPADPYETGQSLDLTQSAMGKNVPPFSLLAPFG